MIDGTIYNVAIEPETIGEFVLGIIAVITQIGVLLSCVLMVADSLYWVIDPFGKIVLFMSIGTLIVFLSLHSIFGFIAWVLATDPAFNS